MTSLASRRRGAAVVLALIGAIALAAAIELPPADRHAPLYDGAGLLEPGDEARLRQRLVELAASGREIGIATFASLDGEPIEEVSIRLAEAWRPGSAERDDGLLIVVAARERRVRIEVGYGLEERIPDIIAGRIIREQIAPRFRRGDWAGGLDAAVTALAAAAGGDPLPPPARGAKRRGLAALMLVALVVWIGIGVVLGAVHRRVRTSRGLGPGGVAGADVPLWLLWLLHGSGRSHRGGRFHGGGGFGGFSGGGFGGFGGGGFGGGGASGGW